MSERVAGQQILITLERSGDHSVRCRIPENTDGTKYRIPVLQNTNNRSKVGVGEEVAKTIRHLGNISSLLLPLQPILHESTFLVLDLDKLSRAFVSICLDCTYKLKRQLTLSFFTPPIILDKMPRKRRRRRKRRISRRRVTPRLVRIHAD